MIIPIVPANPDNNSSNNENNNEWSEMVASMPADKEMTGFGAPTVDETETEGIRIDFVVPEGAERCNLYIDGIGHVCEAWDTQNGVGTVFYPFVDKGKTYKILLEFVYEDYDSEGFTIRGNSVGWKALELTAKGGKGEVLLTKNSDVSISSQNNGDFNYTAPEFSNESAIPDWYMLMGLCAGDSWEREDHVRHKWHSHVKVKGNELNKTHNVYLEYESWSSKTYPIDFICYRPQVDYTDSNGKTWTYRWGHVVKDNVNLPSADSVWTPATSADLIKLVGTKWERSYDDYNEGLDSDTYYVIHECTLEIVSGGGTNYIETITITRKDGADIIDSEEDVKSKLDDYKKGIITFDKKSGKVIMDQSLDVDRATQNIQLYRVDSNKLKYNTWPNIFTDNFSTFTKK